MASAYALARLVTLTTSAAVLFAAFLLVTPSPLQLALLTLPMSLFQLASAALDGFSTSMAVLAISLYQALPEAQPRHRPILLPLPGVQHPGRRAGPSPSLATADSSLFLSARKIKSAWAWFTSLACLSTVLIWVARVSRSTVDLRRAQLSTDTVQTAIQFLSHPGELIASTRADPHQPRAPELLLSLIYRCARLVASSA